jgi:cell division protein FtsL
LDFFIYFYDINEQMKQDSQTKILFIATIIMLIMVFLIAKHYRNEVFELKQDIKKLEILIEKHGRDSTRIQR